MYRIDDIEKNCDYNKINNPAYLAWLIREGIATTKEGFYSHFGLMPYGPRTGTYILDKALDNLLLHKIIALLNGQSYSLPDSFVEIQRGLEFSLSDLAKSDRNHSIICEPIFGKPSNEFQCHVFVIMPFGEPYNEFYAKVIKPICSLDEKLIVKRADDPTCLAGESITKNIYQFIYQSKLIVADISNGNPNVFYELGVAHTMGKKVILLNGNRKFKPFDIQDLQYIAYQFDSQPKMDKMKEKLRRDVSKIIGEYI